MAGKNARITEKMKSNARKSIKEPTFTMLEHPTESELLHNVSWYNLHYDQRKSKEWAMEWIERNNALSQFKKDFEAISHPWFGNRGFFCRMAGNGWQMSTERRQSFEKSFLEMLDMYKRANPEPIEKPAAPIVKYDGPKLKEDPFWNALVDCEDNIIANKGDLDKMVELEMFNVVGQLSPQAKKRARREIERHRKQLVEDVKWAGDDVMHADKRTSKRIIKRLINQYDKWLNKGIKV